MNPHDCLQNVMLDVEADCYWCLCKLIHGIQDQYTYAQPGIQRAVFKIHELIGWVPRMSGFKSFGVMRF